ncbi:MAG: STAS-like domain-containing protein, partial [Lachnospiraceae bacterium]|nr:STAS-like domain-containing protein [Lachnospiraceae bacterium]
DDSCGTAVIMKLANNSKKTCKDIFDQYSDENYSFMKTTIPMAGIYDSDPVSRSQAKRLCNRLENFKEIVLDVDGIDWMGQGFAHQIFVVFAKAHQDILLTPINMSDDVLKMYRHVTAQTDMPNSDSMEK